MQLDILPTVQQSWTILQIAQSAIPASWKSTFIYALPEINHISKKLDEDKVFGAYLPLKSELFNAFKYTDYNNVKVIILDYEASSTYININGKSVPKDFGLSYAIRYGDEPSKSIEMMYKEIKRTYKSFITPDHPDFSKWCKQGVLLLHQCLTNSPSKPHSEYNIWHDFLKKVFKSLVDVNPNVIIVLLGRRVQCVNQLIPDSFVRLEATGPHEMKAADEFVGSNIFKNVNDALVKQKKTVIDWQL